MRAFVLSAPRRGAVVDLPWPRAAPGEAVVEVRRAGVCGTDVEFFTGEMAYLRDGSASYPMRLGHEWAGVVSAVGDGVGSEWIGRRVIGDTMLGCGHCRNCARGDQHVCAEREEVGIRRGRPGALAQALAVPVTSLHGLPDTVDDVLGALVEPGANALRAACASGAGDGDRVLVLGPGTIGLLCAMFLRAAGAEVHLLGLPGAALDFARGLGFDGCWTREELPDELTFDAVVEASGAAALPALALSLVRPAGRVVYIGLAETPTPIDTRALVLGDVTAIGVLSGSPGLEATIAAYAGGDVDPRGLVAATVALDDVADVLAGHRPDTVSAPGAPKIHIDPSLQG